MEITVGGDLFAGGKSVTFIQVPEKLFEAPSSVAQPPFAGGLGKTSDAQSGSKTNKGTDVHPGAASSPHSFPLLQKEKYRALGQGRKGKFLLARDQWGEEGGH